MIQNWLVTATQKGGSTDAHTKLLSTLICRALIKRLCGKQQVFMCKRFLEAITHGHGLDDLRSSERSENGKEGDMDDATVLKGIALKPNNRTTLQKVLLSTVVTIVTSVRPSVPPKGSSLNFFVEVLGRFLLINM